MITGRSVTPWTEVFRTDFERVERTVVVGGWIYRDWVVFSSDSQHPQVSLVFVPTNAPLTPAVIDNPHVTGVGAVGETLSCTMGNWENDPNTYSYQWQSGGTNVGTNSNSYVIQASDSGKSIVCIVTATNGAGSTVAPPSNAIAVS